MIGLNLSPALGTFGIRVGALKPWPDILLIRSNILFSGRELGVLSVLSWELKRPATELAIELWGSLNSGVS